MTACLCVFFFFDNWAERVAAAFSGFALSDGWQDLFAELNVEPVDLGWQTQDAEGWGVAEQQLRFAGQLQSSIAKGPPLAEYELVVNARIVGRTASFRDVGAAIRTAELLAQHQTILEQAQEVAA